ncbi:quinolinate synthase NadA [Thiospirochaeta perfilievii]|uniref:Quinolinate synthase n=1 Tax=Thiospirochaeta perfilievii TaxID=252967 RepID=A0A5C1QBD3_9SPIO|nr:quinolinate synthase NadA [Thiospirochaeta perfilievii]QEN04688.1 quinolinate synthase NadA [Thiospirochaeta perfilievii]
MGVLPEYSKEVKEATDHLYELVKDVIPRMEWEVKAPYIYRINQLKKEKNILILAHNYMTPDIFHCISDIKGDSLGLAREAAKTDADTILVCGVYFMAETTKVLSPDKRVLISDPTAGCSLADSITGADVKKLRQEHPGVPIVTYVNTTAETKAEVDICCTSGNALKIIESIDSDEILFVPDRFLCRNMQTQTDKKLIEWSKGSCEVHELFTVESINEFRAAHDGLVVIAHPECPREIVEASDFSGSTADMINFVEDRRPKKVLMVTECSMSDNLTGMYPDVEFVRPCNLCPHMKKITLENVLETMETMSPEVFVAPEVIDGAKRSVERMLEVK